MAAAPATGLPKFTDYTLLKVIGAAVLLGFINQQSPIIGAWLIVLLALGALVYHDQLAKKLANPQIESV